MSTLTAANADEPGERLKLQAVPDPDNPGTGILKVTGGPGDSGDPVSVIVLPPLMDVGTTNLSTSATPNASTEADTYSATGRYIRIVNVSDTPINVRIGSASGDTDEAIAPGKAFEPPHFITAPVYVSCAEASKAFVLYIIAPAE